MFNTAMKMNEQDFPHLSVMSNEIGEMLRPKEGGTYLDATLGFGGHTLELLKRTNFKSRIICIDADPEAISWSKKYISQYCSNIEYINRNFSEIDEILDELNIKKLDGVVADLGLSSYQLESSGRGFSFQKDEFLDMRMGKKTLITAFNIINNSSEDELIEIFKNYGEEKFAGRIAADIVKIRGLNEIRNTAQLVSLVKVSIPKKFHPKKIHPATKVFQALRIAVNNELNNLRDFIDKSVLLLNQHSRIAIISFHSLEDKIVKYRYRSFSERCICPPKMPVCGCGRIQLLKVVTKKALTPSTIELQSNIRARSAKLRIAEKI